MASVHQLNRINDIVPQEHVHTPIMLTTGGTVVVSASGSGFANYRVNHDGRKPGPTNLKPTPTETISNLVDIQPSLSELELHLDVHGCPAPRTIELRMDDVDRSHFY